MKAISLMERFGRPIEGIVHVGANRGQEAPFYKLLPGVPCIYVEPIPAVFEQLKSELGGAPGHHAIQAVCSDVVGQTVKFNIADNNGEASSMLGASEHLTLFPHVKFTDQISLTTTTLDTVVSDFPLDTFNLIVIDTQGAELKVLQGARDLLHDADGLFLEVSEVPLYDGGCTLDMLEGYLRSIGFYPKWLEMNQFRYGDAFFLREPSLEDVALPEAPGENLALGRPATQSSIWNQALIGGAARGNNGARTGDYGFHTDHEQRPWWKVDLEELKLLREVRIYNRLGITSDRARTLLVHLSTDGSTWQQVHDQSGRRFGGVDGRPLRVRVDGQTARFVRISLPGDGILHLDEVEVY